MEENEYKILDIATIIEENSNMEEVADSIISGTFYDNTLLHKNSLDRFLDYVIFKAKTGTPYIINLAYPTKKISDKKIESKIRLLLNEYLFPDIIFLILKYFSRNSKDADTNLYLAELIESPQIIKAIYDTFVLIKNDIFEKDKNKRCLNVKRLQQVPAGTEIITSSPLDTACIFKYILEYFILVKRNENIYTANDLKFSL